MAAISQLSSFVMWVKLEEILKNDKKPPIWEFPATTAARCHRDDETGLLAFKSGIKADPSGMLNKWKLGTDCCKWYGIACNGPQNRVNSLDLYGAASYSPLPRNIGNLTKLQSLILARNSFSGSIPSSLTKLTQLSTLDLSGNRLLGTIPSSIGQLTKLFELNLSGNKLSGSIPDNFSTITMLTFIMLSNNNFTGKFPKSISNLNPREIDLGSNSLTGKLPEFLGRFDFLKTLNLSWNQFSGTVPKTLAHPELYTLDLSHNLFNGPFPKLTFIHVLDLSYNNFHFGDIPKWITSTYFLSLNLAQCGLNSSLNDWKPLGPFFLPVS
ncbi:Leucine-rich repeat (LRR) family protein [Forsythia ovata]|uniref:Leucine-rich repeat (LRR) family protein n=1 Tax=Forsythia ovata TaxID=205694 RepID=A0ABD1PGZ9_9LAMI